MKQFQRGILKQVVNDRASYLLFSALRGPDMDENDAELVKLLTTGVIRTWLGISINRTDGYFIEGIQMGISSNGVILSSLVDAFAVFNNPVFATRFRTAWDSQSRHFRSHIQSAFEVMVADDPAFLEYATTVFPLWESMYHPDPVYL